MQLDAGKWKNGHKLFLISFLILFFELVFIRWVSSHILYISYFSNFILVASFVGMSLGCFIANRLTSWIRNVPWMMFGIIALTVIIGTLIDHRIFLLTVDDPDSPERIFFGAIFPAIDFTGMTIQVEWVLALIFIFVVLFFIGLGQVLGQCLDRSPNRIVAYTLNIVGSLFGILTFALISVLWLSPVWWFAIGLLCLTPFLQEGRREMKDRFSTPRLILMGACFLLVVFLFSSSNRYSERVWSPYYRIDYFKQNLNIVTNGLAHQNMMDQSRFNAGYSLPFLLLKDARKEPVQDVLIIGAGSGNDVAAALQHVCFRSFKQILNSHNFFIA